MSTILESRVVVQRKPTNKKTSKKSQTKLQLVDVDESNIRQFTYVYLDALYENVSGFDYINLDEIDIDKFDFPYSELSYYSGMELLSVLNMTPLDVFYHINSGVGKFVTQSLILSTATEVVGIEPNINRFQKSVEVSQQVKANMPEIFEANERKYSFVHGKWDEEEYHRATVLFFDCDGLNKKDLFKLSMIINKCSNLRAVACTRPISCKLPFFGCMKTVFNWGEGECYIYGKAAPIPPEKQASKSK